MKYAATDQVVAISGAIKTILSNFGVPDVAVIPSSALPPQKAWSAELSPFASMYPQKKIIATAAAFVPHKDPLTMVQAIAALRELRGRDFVFLHYGEGPLRQSVEAETSRLDLGECYQLMGFHNQILPLFPFFHVFVMSSNEEGLGSSVLDAFLAGVPVVSTAAGGLKELVSGRGILCPVGQADCLAQGIHTILNQPEETRLLVEAAKDYVQKHHHVADAAQAYLDLFENLLVARKRNGRSTKRP